ncbi:MAG: hypothetical protein JO264_00255 [Acidisphaera sp.]|nr:hypothetical protein [Acidisphaera sp.]
MDFLWPEARRQLASYQPTETAEPRSLLFLAAEDADGAADAVREAALDLGRRAGAPVLLLDLALPANGQHGWFSVAGRLLPRRTPMAPPAADRAVLHFQRVEESWLHVSRVEPDPAGFTEEVWAQAAEAMPRLLGLFGALVIAAPALAVSPGGLRLAPATDGVVLVIRYGATSADAAVGLRDRVLGAAGKPVGVVMTHCPAGPVMHPMPWLA